MTESAGILERLRAGVQTQSCEETRALARELAVELPENSVLAMQGDLGAGKTTFVGGLAEALGIKQAVTSPTYNLYNLYAGRRQLVHIDAYRLEDHDQANSLMLEDVLQEPWLMVVEWPERFPPAWLKHAQWLRLSFVDEQTRHLQLEAGKS